MHRPARHYVRWHVRWALTLAASLAALAGAALAAAALTGSVALADSGGSTTTYRWVDAQGVVHYSDTPQPGAQKLQIQPAQTFPDQAISANSAPTAVQAEPPANYQACLITQPTAQQSFYAPQSLAVSVQLSPTLRAGDQLSVTMDGKALQPVDESGLNFQVADPFRGAHTIEAMVRDAGGRTLCRAASVTFYVQRPSLLSPQVPSLGHGAATAPPVPRS